MAGEVVSGVGAKARRTDLGNVAAIQRKAKIQNAPGGSYGQRAELRNIAQGAAPTPTASAVSAAPVQATPRFKAVDAFTPAPEGMLTDGAGFNTLGAAPDTVQQSLTSPDPGRALAAAMYLMNPNQYTRMLVESFDAEAMY